MTRKSLADILGPSKSTESLVEAWENTEAAAEFAPIPKGEYDAVLASGELFTAKSGTPGYKLTFEIPEGEYRGRKFWHDLWFTAAAMPMAKRDLAKIGVTSLAQLERPLPARFLCKAKVSLRKNDDGIEHNRVVTFEVTGVEKADPFAPPPLSVEEPK